MKRLTGTVWTLALLAALTATARADEPSAKQLAREQRRAEARARKEAQREAKRERERPRREARAFRKLEVPGEEVVRNAERLTTELRWHASLAEARATAAREGKPVLWIQALGDLEGFL